MSNTRKYDIIEKVFTTISVILESNNTIDEKVSEALKYKNKANKIELVDIKEIVIQVYDELVQNLHSKTLSFKTSCDMLDILIKVGFQSNDRFIGDYSYRLSMVYARLSTIVYFTIKDESPFESEMVYTTSAYKYYNSEIQSFHFMMMQYII